ncbi:hypothetical protein LMG19083_02998 [Ralstonia psammae]|uniref:Uncharacterized protein n=1 Tax=Ralstonia psammae TaxID=3058598 RepID=A0ABM9JM48_9RALS|nr:hypothetical protein [Ralstonia sp. LMG 19083]CAJ0797346.1 hypothetical protein LMG19083_02998 [Ralstonia sp. LMG 19083]
MPETGPKSTFRGLPLTPEQDAEIRHYIKLKTHRGQPWDTPELDAMLRDMLEPPLGEQEESDELVTEEKGEIERAASSIDEAMEPIEASEERNAAKESEAMKKPQH